MSRDPIAYKVLTDEQLATLESGSFAGAPVDLADGYIHLCGDHSIDCHPD